MLYTLARRLLFQLDPETAHDLTLGALRLVCRGPIAAFMTARAPLAPTRVMGIDFPNPVGLAAGLDKNGDYLEALAALGFGFIELGTVTPRPQPGNPKPRLFRLPQAQALINRMGFNNLDFGQNVVSLAYAVMSWVDVQLKSYQSVITFWKINALQLLELIGSLSNSQFMLKLPINSPDTQVWMLKSYSFQPLDIHAVAVKTDKFVQSPVNNRGVDYLLRQVRHSRFRGVLGINIGKNFDTPLDRAADDYVLCLDRVYP